MKSLKVSFYSIGCKVNFAETSEIQKQFEQQGVEIVDFGDEADIVLINTCTVTKRADADCRKIIRRAIRKSPNAFIGVLGCYAQLRKDEIMKIEGVDAVFGTDEKFNISSLIDNWKKKSQPEIYISNLEKIPFHTACSSDIESHTRVVLKIQDGCDYRCSYCTVPDARGSSRSMPFVELKEFFERNLNNSDFHEVILSGINLAEYKSPSGENFTDIIKFIENSGFDKRVRVSSIEPNLLTNEVIKIVAKSYVICHHFHIPLQSGSPKILKLMRRRYNIYDFTELILNIKNQISDCCIGVDVITGFPGETEEDFIDTYKLLEQLPISYFHVFTYSEREGTEAYKLTDFVPNKIRKNRTEQLRLLSVKKKHNFYETQLGKILKVIPEEYNELTSSWKGWSDNYCRIEFHDKKNITNLPLQIMLKDIIGDIILGEKVKS